MKNVKGDFVNDHVQRTTCKPMMILGPNATLRKTTETSHSRRRIKVFHLLKESLNGSEDVPKE